ncbi:hypothetical protein, partial [Streptomyces sp. SID3343]|uniref:hypothetical protein n=1 Tax=Streptomyces sp. SID3343 TaxID=2690260 RepID=UPI00136A4DF2
MTMPDGTWLDYEVMGGSLGGQSIVARYRTRTGAIEFDTLRVPDGTLAALIRAILDRTDQNLVTDIL